MFSAVHLGNRGLWSSSESLKRALITGITGQDGSYLAELLLHKGYEVHGLIRKSSTFNTGRIDHIYRDPHDPESHLLLHYGDLADFEEVSNLVYNIRPDEIYHLGAQTHVQVSFEMPAYTGSVTGLGATRLLEAVRRSGVDARVYQASSSEMFGASPPPQGEQTPFMPQSPYAVAKLYAYWMTVNYRDSYSLFASNGVLFNHESPRRGETFLTRKVTRAIAEILAGRQDRLYLGNLDALRDWGYAPEYVQVMWQILQLDSPDDFVIGTGEQHSVREFVSEAFRYAGLDWEQYVEIDERYLRPTEVPSLCADISKAQRALDWTPLVKFPQLVQIMVDADMSAAGLEPPGDGFRFADSTFGDWHLVHSPLSGD